MAPKAQRQGGVHRLMRFCIRLAGRSIQVGMLVLFAVAAFSWAWSHWTAHGVLWRVEGMSITFSGVPSRAEWRVSTDSRSGVLTREVSRAVIPESQVYVSKSIATRADWIAKPLLPERFEAQQTRQQIAALIGGWQIGDYGGRFSRSRMFGVWSGIDIHVRVPLLAIVFVIGTTLTLWLAIEAKRNKRRRNGLRRRCENCGYDLLGLTPDAVCPECGIDRSYK